MKITFVVPPANLSGGIRVIACLAGGLAARGHEITLVSKALKNVRLKQKVRSIVRDFLGLSAGEKSHLDHVGVSCRVVPYPRNITNGDVPDGDVVIATWWETALTVAQLSARKGAKAYFVQLDERKIRPDDAAWTEGVAASWRLPLQKIATSQCVKEALRAEAGAMEIPVVVNGVDMEQFHARSRQRNKVPVVGLLCAATQRKGFDVACQVIEKVRAAIPNVKVIALSAAKPGADVRMPAGTKVYVRPTQDRLKDIYAQCDVWLCASRAEGFHLPPMEAMACRCPVVSTRVGGPVDMIESGVNGFLNDVEDVEGLARSVLRVLTMSAAEWHCMSDAAVATARRYSWETTIADFERALKGIVEASRKGTSRSQDLAHAHAS